jgi:4-amino-4-deoxy-L-arabinose transferase-like glycosyltransferase
MLLALVLLLAAVLRIARLDTLPPAIFRDEAEKAYNAFSILHTGRDVEGRRLPLFLHVFGVTTSAIYQYVAIPFIAAFGLNEWGARLPAACVATATVAMTYLLVRRLRDARTAAWAALLLTLSPWHITFSRWAQQGIFLPLLLSIGAYGVVRFASAPNSRRSDAAWLFLGALSFGLTTYAYDVARMFVPALLVFVLIAYWPVWRSRWRHVAAGIVGLLLGAAPAIYVLFASNESAQARFRFVSILQPGAGAASVLGAFVRNYFQHWSPGFLLLHGDAELRHGAGTGTMTLVEILGLIAGIVVLFRERRRANVLWLGWLLLWPVAASLTRIGIPHALRSIVSLPAMQVVAAIGIEATVQHIRIERRALFQQLVLLLALLTFVPFGLRYYSHQYRVVSAFSWQDGLKEALRFADSPGLKSADIYLHNVVGAEYLVPFYEQMPVQQVQQSWTTPPSRMGRFIILPFQREERLLTTDNTAPAAYISVPGNYSWPASWRPIGFYPANDERQPPVLFMFLNDALKARLPQ